jgi:hypothetical protein
MILIPPPISMELARQRQLELQTAAAAPHERRYRNRARHWHVGRAAHRKSSRHAT